MRGQLRNGYFALAIYTLCAILAFWFPRAIALVLTAIWVGWLVLSIRIKAVHMRVCPFSSRIPG